ncbi:hypothetical protein HanIR_Chr03g0127201 [Helianthus annuus]|nr:hypothetical protein HanIR_Chr03g0127201 [Helianthus annuus]
MLQVYSWGVLNMKLGAGLSCLDQRHSKRLMKWQRNKLIFFQFLVMAIKDLRR